ncbi:hypothetical protein CKO31_05845 [Thiohalocapsa halophila]|uniref:Uncharacterized protein n=2 Tax=Thiohalocapsa halophila TaxID=69359 RepID=A0ABS1CED6_9GAMM|nr:hypothetical protein [Thiohalocapsa halophila]
MTAGAEDLLFANGDCHPLPAGHADFLAALCRRSALTAEAVLPWLDAAPCADLLTHLFNAGHFLTPGVGD